MDEEHVQTQPASAWGLRRGDRDLGADAEMLLLFGGTTLFLFGFAVYAGAVLSVMVTHFTILGIGIVSLSRQDEQLLFARVYFWNIVAILFLYCVYIMRHGTPYYLGGSDGLMFETKAREIAAATGVFEYGEIRGGVVRDTFNSVGYVYFLSLVYRLGETFGGFHTFMPRLINAGALATLCIMVYRTGRKFMSLPRAYAQVAALVTGLAPLMMWISGQTFRDILVATLMFLPVYIFCCRRLTLLNVILVAVIPVILWEFRTFSALAVIGLIGACAFLRIREQRPVIRKTGYLIAAIGVFSVAVWVVRQGLLAWFGAQVFYYYQTYTELRGEELSSGLAQYVFLAPQPLSGFLRLVYYSISPIPLPFLRVERSIISVGTIVHIFFLPFLLKGLWRSMKTFRLAPIYLAFLGIFVGEAQLSFSTRHMSMFYPFAVLLTTLGFLGHQRSGKSLLSTWLFIYFILAFGVMAYALLKF